MVEAGSVVGKSPASVDARQPQPLSITSAEAPHSTCRALVEREALYTVEHSHPVRPHPTQLMRPHFERLG